MKKYNLVTIKVLLLCCLSFLSLSLIFSQKPDLVVNENLKKELAVKNEPVEEAVLTADNFSVDQLKMKWEKYNENDGWKKLLTQAEAKGFKRIPQSSWGFSGTITTANSKKSVPVEFCAFDFYSPSAKNEKSFQTCSMIWKKIGDSVYKAYIVFPKGENDREKSLVAAQEWYADNNNQVQKAHSFHSCFNNCISGGKHGISISVFGIKMNVTADCKNSCLAGVAVCGGVTAILDIASGGLGTPALIAVFGACAGVTCGQCFAMCALGCQ